MPEPETVEELRAMFPQPDAETPAVEAETVEEPTEAVEVEQPADEPTDEPAEETVEAETPTLLAGKYKDVEELERAYLESQSAIGRQGNELSELRALKDEFTQLREQIQQPAAPAYDPGSLEEFFDSNPQQIPAITQQALESGDAFLYQKSLEAWGQLDQVGAMDFHARAVADSRAAEIRAEIAPLIATTQRAETNSQFARAYEAKVAQHPDFNDVMNAITPEHIQGFPKPVLAALESNDPQTKMEVLETLYRWTKAEQAGQLTQAAAQVAVTQAQDAQQARQEAVVASTAASSDRTEVQKSGVDIWREQLHNSPAFRKAAGQS